jgi:uncharacterized protein
MSGTDKHIGPGEPEEPEFGTPAEAFRRAVQAGDIPGTRGALQRGADVNEFDAATGLAALHLAVGYNDMALARVLIEEGGAAFFPDRFGRWPSLIAAENRVDDELSLYIVEKEAEFLAREQSGASGP